MIERLIIAILVIKENGIILIKKDWVERKKIKSINMK